ncbi:MAG: hypothetical protein KDC73_01795 [Ignavibacteriae bacterium]|nr:hypothetical protein [Ignavibacteriota bacterium]MCB0723408.1 hypothetical protein [Ignavibacteriota bacterium]MCB9243254.1 hypothetical protein [Ignavibacteriales bacterium]
MAKVKSSNLQKLKSKKSKKEEHLHLSLNTMNYSIIGLGIVVIIIGYMLMASDRTVDGFMATVLSPILLVIGYCVIIPVGVLYGGNFKKKAVLADTHTSAVEEEVIKEEENTPNVKTSSNIKTS